MMTVYGFAKDKLSTRHTCMFEIELYEEQGKVKINMKASPLSGTFCLHRDTLPAVVLEEEADPKIIERDDMFFKNLEALEYTLTVASFEQSGVRGDWFVT